MHAAATAQESRSRQDSTKRGRDLLAAVDSKANTERASMICRIQLLLSGASNEDYLKRKSVAAQEVIGPQCSTPELSIAFAPESEYPERAPNDGYWTSRVGWPERVGPGCSLHCAAMLQCDRSKSATNGHSIDLK